jgi:hypothetical protein
VNINESKRDFLKLGSALLGGAFLTTHMGAVLAAAKKAADQQAAEAPWQVLTNPEVAELAAMADQIYPPDDSAGAAEIGAVRFMDVALGGFMADALPLLRLGLVELQTASSAAYAGTAAFSALGFDQQTLVLKGMENTGFFSLVHFLTLAGVFSLPEYGGNQNQEGWRQIAFERRHVWQPPFGYYDARYAKGGENES